MTAEEAKGKPGRKPAPEGHISPGQARLLDAAVQLLVNQGDFKLDEVCKITGLSSSLVSKYWPTGVAGLKADAYETILVKQAQENLALLQILAEDPTDFQPRLEQILYGMMSPEKVNMRITRLETLASARRNPLVVPAIEKSNATLSKLFDATVTMLPGREISLEDMWAFSVLGLGLAVGVTAMTQSGLTDAQRATLARAWASMVSGHMRTIGALD